MPRIELINMIEQLQAKLDTERQSRSELNKEILGILIRA